MHMTVESLEQQLERTRQARQASERRFRNIIERNADGILVVDRQGIVRFVNRAAERMLGRSADELVGSPFGFPMAAGQMTEIDLVRGDGEPAVAEMHVTESEWEERPVYLATLRDITARVQAEETLRRALEESQQRQNEIQSLLVGAQAVLKHRDFEVAARAIFEACKQATGATAGCIAMLSEDGSENEVLFLDAGGQECTVDPELPMPIRGLRAESYRTGRAVYENDFSSSEWMRFMPEGHASLDSVMFAPLIVEGQVVGLVGLANKPGGFTEADAQVAAGFGEFAAIAFHNSQILQALRRSEKRFRSLFNVITDAVFVHDLAGGAFQEVNQEACERLGYSREELLHMTPADIDSPKYAALIPQRLDELRRHGHAFFETEHVRRDGTTIPIELNSQIIEYGGKPTILSVARDITQRKRAEEALRESEERYRVLIESIRDSVYVLDEEWRHIVVNDAAERFTGIPRDELLGATLTELFPGIEDTAFFVAFQRVMETRQPDVAVAEYTFEDGRRRWYEVHVYPVPEGILCLSRDITQRKRAEDALRRAERRLDRMLQTMVDGMVVVNLEGQITYANRSAERILEIHHDEILERYYHERAWRQIDDEGNPYPQDQLPLALALGERREVEGIEHGIIAPDGTVKWLSVNAAPLFDEQDRLHGAVASFRDITERKRAEEALRESEEKFRSLVEQSHDGVLVMDERGIVVEWNPALERIIGIDRTEAIGQPAWDVQYQAVPEEKKGEMTRARIEGALRRLIETKQSPWLHNLREVTVQHSDGTIKTTEQVAFPIRTDQGFMMGTIFRDITERKRMEQQLRQQERLAAVGQLAAGIAHDFRNLLTATMLHANMALGQPDLPPKLTQHLTTIIGESKRAADLVQQILDFSSRSMLRMQALDLHRLTQDVMDVLRRTLPEKVHLSLEVNPGDRGTGFTVQADPGRIQQMLTNLAMNARDAMPGGGDLRFALSRVEVAAGETPPVAHMEPGAWVCLTVSDTGTGMTEEVRAHLFEPFFTTKDVGRGTGLGLAQVYGIVRQHEGYIGVETELGRGTTFRIYLPAPKEETGRGPDAPTDEADIATPMARPASGSISPASAEEIEAGKPSTPSQEQRKTILLVEDNEMLRQAGQSILQALGYRVLTAVNGREALALYKAEGGADLVITDVVMPEMDGKELIRELSRSDPTLKVVGITGYAVEKVGEELREAGFLDVIYKPFEIETLTQVVRRALDEDGCQKPRWGVK